MKRVFSGVQPTGQIHLGNYITMKNFVRQQDDKDCIYCVVDLHSITLPQDPEQLKKSTIELAALYLAIGLDPKKVTLFIQSQVSAHAELAWILNCFSYMGELNRMTQFKDKSEGKKAVTTGLFTYPLLMASDILLYDTNYVPVGNDQKQHLELTRDIAIRFNNRFGETFVVPEPIIAKVEEGARIMAFDDPTQKMSKSNPNEHSKITLLESAAKVKKTIMKSTTDSHSEVKYDFINKPGVSNLLTIYSQFSGESIPSIVSKYEGQGYGALKKDLVGVVQSELDKVQSDFQKIITSGDVYDVLKQGRERANALSTVVLDRVKKQVGFVTF
ncbi:tryptophan--tRNA ligase [Fusibacter ferrireducens]|uniref:Tryptophan--tRNA ligase n=1 Tax=Fusibacter ferrireducens TaxID=2785058 RepID=A0ABR9ZY78_9FIRM|nr:tryptophan--tRNA ligase [Fusibacter ferrireducens]MBF4695425.1 tryptophan--tRNA ligase [Fusibacter ferrireducens]